MLKVLPTVLAHIFAGWLIAPGVAGIVVGVIFPVVEAALVPQAFVAVTDTVPMPEPIVIVAETVVPPAVTDQPVPVTDQVYDAAPITGAMLKMLPNVLAHLLAGCVIAPGVAGVAGKVAYVIMPEFAEVPQLLTALTL